MAAKKRIEVVEIGYTELLEILGMPRNTTLMVRGVDTSPVDGGRYILGPMTFLEAEYNETNWVEHVIKARTPIR